MGKVESTSPCQGHFKVKVRRTCVSHKCVAPGSIENGPEPLRPAFTILGWALIFIGAGLIVLLGEDFARKVAGGLAKAETDFEARRQIIDLLDVRATLAIEEGRKVAYVRCLVDEAEFVIKTTTR